MMAARRDAGLARKAKVQRVTNAIPWPVRAALFPLWFALYMAGEFAEGHAFFDRAGILIGGLLGTAMLAVVWMLPFIGQ